MIPRRGAEEDGQLTALKFKQPLSWQAGKPIATSELLTRLETLSDELRDLGDEQEEVQKDSLKKVAKELASQHLLSHRDKGVRAFTACCLVDVLKICAPDAPFTPSQLKARPFPALSNPSHAYNQQHKYVLASLAEVKSVVLLCDIPSSDSLVLHLFSNVFDMMSGSSSAGVSEQISRDVEFNMMQILVILVDEAQNLPSRVVDIIVAQFLRVSTPGGGRSIGKNKQERDETQSTLLIKELPAAYNMAKTICNSCSDKMARYVSQYFNEVIMEVSIESLGLNGHRKGSVTATGSEEETPTGPTEADLKELEKAHSLLRELWRASPPVLQNVIPQLEHELSADDVQLRLLATETLGDIISGIGAAGPPPPPIIDSAAYLPATSDDNVQLPISDSILTTPISPQSFAQTHPSVYKSFLSRKNDKSLVIRSGWTTAVGRILLTSAGGIGLSSNEEKIYIKGLAEKLNDSDERVRLAAVKAVGGFSFRDIMSKIAPTGGVSNSGSVLGSLADRARDRKHIVRAEAMKVLCRTWGVATGEILSGNMRVIDALSAIPSKVFDVYYANDPEMNVLLDHSMFEQLIPLTYPLNKTKSSRNTGGSQATGNGPINVDKIRTERILLLVNSLDAKSRRAFFAMQARQPFFAKVLETYLACCEDYNGGVVEGNINEVKAKLELPIKWFTKVLPDPSRVNQDLHKFAKIHDRRSYQLLRFAMNPRSDFSTVHKAIKELTKRIQANPTAPSGLLETLYPIIYRSACLIYNRSNQTIFSQYSKTNEHGFGTTANAILQEISEKHPEIFQASLKELCNLLAANSPSSTKPNDPVMVETLKSLASFVKSEKNKIPYEKKFVQTLLNFALYGTPFKTAKYATIILAASTDRKEMHMNDLLNNLIKDWNYADENSLTKLAAINQLIVTAPSITEDSNQRIQEICLKILNQASAGNADTDQEWQDDSNLDKECQAKCLSIKILVSRLRSIQDDVEQAKTLAVSIFKLLNTLIEKKGEISIEGRTPKSHQSRLRLLAARQILKLCTIEIFDKAFAPREFYNLCYISQDPLEDVRRRFVGKLQKYLVKSLLPNRFLTIIFLTAFEPSQSFRNSIMTWIRSRVKVAQDTKKGIFEAIFPRLLHLLAHHPDYSPVPDELLDHARYILYYISTVSSEENLPHIYKYAQRVKQGRDALPGADSDRLYILSDLAQALIRKWEEKKGWSMQSWPKQVGLPIGLFMGLSNHDVAQEIANKIYISEELDTLLDALVREIDRKKKRKPDDLSSSHPSKRIKAEKQARTQVARRERPVKEKWTPKPRKGPPITPVTNSGTRRSGRAKNERKIYEERDSSEDDEEMWEGVAEWEYLSEDGASSQNKEKNKARDSDGEMNLASSPLKNSKATLESELDGNGDSGLEGMEPDPQESGNDDRKAEEAASEGPTRPASVVSPSRPTRSLRNRTTSSAISKLAKSTPKSSPSKKPSDAHSKSPTRLKKKMKPSISKAKDPAASSSKAKAKGKAKE